MKQQETELERLTREAYEIAEANGFWAPSQANFAQKIALIHSELSEALEADRKGLNDDKLTNRDGREVELADALIRILDLAEGFNLDLEGAVEEKMEYNKSRTYKHGKGY